MSFLTITSTTTSAIGEILDSQQQQCLKYWLNECVRGQIHKWENKWYFWNKTEILTLTYLYKSITNSKNPQIASDFSAYIFNYMILTSQILIAASSQERGNAELWCRFLQSALVPHCIHSRMADTTTVPHSCWESRCLATAIDAVFPLCGFPEDWDTASRYYFQIPSVSLTKHVF